MALVGPHSGQRDTEKAGGVLGVIPHKRRSTMTSSWWSGRRLIA
nr:hypothetical protein [Streptomyces avermitilis]